MEQADTSCNMKKGYPISITGFTLLQGKTVVSLKDSFSTMVDVAW